MSNFSERDQLLHTWLTQVFPNQNLQHQRLAGDASFRGYHRLTVGDKQYIVMDAPPDKESVKEFIAVDKLMATHVHVPKLEAIDEAQGFIVMEDLGATDFADVIAKDVNNSEDMVKTERHYQQAMQEILAIQQIDLSEAEKILPPYDEALLTREMSLFTEWFLPYIGVELSEKTKQIWQNLQAEIIKQVTAQPQVVVHRDFHSRNLMVLDGTDELGVIDFQDAVIGAYSYDLASLLRDAYINFDENWVSEHLAKFYQLGNIESRYTKSLGEFSREFNVMSMQRHLKVLGIFIRLFQRDGKDRYLANMPKVMGDLMTSLQAVKDDNQTFSQFYQWLNDEVKVKFEQKFS
ncbi:MULTISPECIES: aminoglycoside phosphotransferase family protein [unclassified Moraxella]|uniref:aminoglycoside phosphotransferase family protein n=1 Tax=unclassified Moraxella TaxID=2685852 RepID=UPI003AF79FA1